MNCAKLFCNSPMPYQTLYTRNCGKVQSCHWKMKSVSSRNVTMRSHDFSPADNVVSPQSTCENCGQTTGGDKRGISLKVCRLSSRCSLVHLHVGLAVLSFRTLPAGVISSLSAQHKVVPVTWHSRYHDLKGACPYRSHAALPDRTRAVHRNVLCYVWRR